MTNFSIKILTMNIEAAILVIIILSLRMLLRKVPKSLLPVFWSFVGLKLVLPFSIPLTFFNSKETVLSSGYFIQKIFTSEETMVFSSGMQSKFYEIFNIIWIIGIAAMLCYMFINYVMISRKMAAAVKYDKNTYQSELVNVPFTMGIIQPRIYMPFDIENNDFINIIAHEKAHIRRLDHITKLLAYVLLSLNWFNPFLWIAFILFSEDIEFACDEKVIKEMDHHQRLGYAQTLLNFSGKGSNRTIYILTFGGKTMKKRILSVIKYHKSSVAITSAAAAVVIILGLLSIISINGEFNDNNEKTISIHDRILMFEEEKNDNGIDDVFIEFVDGEEINISVINTEYENEIEISWYPQDNAEVINILHYIFSSKDLSSIKNFKGGGEWNLIEKNEGYDIYSYQNHFSGENHFITISQEEKILW